MSAPSQSLTTAEAAAELGVDVSHVRRLILDGRLRATKRGRDWLIDRVQAAGSRRSPAARSGS